MMVMFMLCCLRLLVVFRLSRLLLIIIVWLWVWV